MKPRRRLWLVALVVSAGVGLLALYLLSTPPQVITLSDGTRLTLLRVTINRHPRYCVGNPFQKICAVLPGKVGDKLSGGKRYDAGRSTQPVLAIWFTCERPTNAWGTARFASEDGETWSATRSLQRWPLDSNRDWGCIIADAWPRRAKEWNLEFSSSDGSRATLRIPNPTTERYEQWDPESLPALRRIGETEIALQAVEVEPYPVFSRRLQSYLNRGSRMGTLYFRMNESGQSTNAWLPVSITLQDATGNSVACADWNPPALASTPLVPPNTIAWSGDWPAVPGENAVKVVVDFARQDDGVSYEVSRQRKAQSGVAKSGVVSQPSTNLQGRVWQEKVERALPQGGRTTAGHRLLPQDPLRLEWIVPATGTITNAP